MRRPRNMGSIARDFIAAAETVPSTPRRPQRFGVNCAERLIARRYGAPSFCRPHAMPCSALTSSVSGTAASVGAVPARPRTHGAHRPWLVISRISSFVIRDIRLASGRAGGAGSTYLSVGFAERVVVEQHLYLRRCAREDAPLKGPPGICPT